VRHRSDVHADAFRHAGRPGERLASRHEDAIVASPTTDGMPMTGPEVLDMARDAIITLVLAASPLMLVGLVVGVVISLFQALTQIQEMTLVFVPKILAIFVTLLLALPFIGDLLQSYMTRLMARVMAGG
jgi:flagellar biosynthetic protein FliQ